MNPCVKWEETSPRLLRPLLLLVPAMRQAPCEPGTNLPAPRVLQTQGVSSALLLHSP